MSGELEFRVVSAVEPFKVVDVVCLEAKLHLEQNSDELLRQHTVKLKITPNASIASRVNLTVHTSNSQGEMSEVDLPVIFAP